MSASEHLFPPIVGPVNNSVVHPVTPECIGPELLAIDSGLTSIVWTANLVTYIPLVLQAPFLVKQFFWQNAAAAADFTDVGIYSADGSIKLGSAGATANSGTNALQKVDVADFWLPFNQRLWLAIGSDSATQAYRGSVIAVAAMDFIGVKQQAAGYSSGLPATATFATPTVVNALPMFGFTGQSVI